LTAPNSPSSTQAWREAMQHFETWLSLSPSERDASLKRLAADNPVLHSRVHGLILADHDATELGFLADGAMAAAGKSDLAAAETDRSLAGSSVGPWKLERAIGAGGMGEVWLARRDDGFYEGDAAVKMLRSLDQGAATNERFAREGQILARLVHPHIARLLDAGVRTDGRRYLVLEYVAGERIDEYCDSQHMDIEARVRLFLQVCAAVGHAHANLVVHRDIKPSNILVDASGEVKLLDFGIAKLLEEQTGQFNSSPLTDLAGAALTPEYAAPEQIEGGTITTATDVYALGVVLCRLLSGFGPYTGGRSAAQLARSIVERDPRNLSDLPDMLDDQRARLAASRSTTPDRLRRGLRGDLEHIVAQALRKLPGERYASVLALTDDLTRYLRREPVLARGDHVGYRIRRFVQRHRLAVALGLLAIITTLGGLGASLWQAHRAQLQAIAAERAAQRAQAITHFLLGIFEANGTQLHDSAAAQLTPARELLDIGHQRIATELKDQPEVREEVLKTLSEMYWQIGRTDQSAAIDQERVEALHAAGRDKSSEMVEALIDWSSTLEEQGHPDEAIEVDKRGIELLDSLQDDSSELRARSLLALGAPLAHSDEVAALAALKQGYSLLSAKYPQSPALVGATSELAATEIALGKTRDAARTIQDTIKIEERLHGPVNALMTELYGQYADVLQAQNHYSRALAAYATSFQLRLKVLGPEHAETVAARALYAQALGNSGARSEALAHLDAINELLGPVPGALAPQYWSRGHLFRARLLADTGDVPGAARELKAIEPVMSTTLSKSGMYARMELIQARERELAGDFPAALAFARRAQRLLAQRTMPCHVGAWLTDSTIVELLQRAHRFDEARPEMQALDQCASPEVDETPFRIAATLAHARDVLGRGDPQQAIDLANSALRLIEASAERGFYALEAAEAHGISGAANAALTHTASAKVELTAAMALLAGSQVPASPRLAEIRARLAALK
jgi:eukaryotic-like serine/threonine-protein kinase